MGVEGGLTDVPAMQSKRILVVEDDDAIQTFVRRVREIEGAWLTVCCDADSADNAWAHDQFDLVVVGINLPVRSGWNFLAKASQRGPDCPVVVFTANVNQQTEERAHSLGAAGFVTKPVGARELVEKLRVCL